MNPDVENCAAEIKKYFYDFKRQQHGKPYAPAERFRKPAIWTAAGEKCIELRASPYDFVRAVFLYNTIPGGPFPNTLASNAAAKWYRQLCTSIGADASSKLSMAQQEVKELIARGLRIITQHQDRPRDLLLDELKVRPDILPAYIRVFLLPKDPDIMEKWGKAAADDLNSDPGLLEAVESLGYDTKFTERY